MLVFLSVKCSYGTAPNFTSNITDYLANLRESVKFFPPEIIRKPTVLW